MKQNQVSSKQVYLHNQVAIAKAVIDDYDMCQACKDAVAVDRARGYRVCRDCYYEMGV